MATAGAIVGLRVRRRARRRHRHHRKDFARLRRNVGADARRVGPARQPGGGPLSTLGDNWENDDVRVRPTRGGSRPRTKTRPSHTDAVSGFVTTVDRGRYTCLVEEGTKRAHVVTAMRARELGPPGRGGRRSGRPGRRHRRRAGHAGPDRPDHPAAQRAAPVGRRHRPGRTGAGGQRRSAGDRLRAGRPGAAHRLHRPLPGRRLHRQPGRGAGADQGRPRRPGVPAGDLRRPRPTDPGHPARRLPPTVRGWSTVSTPCASDWTGRCR